MRFLPALCILATTAGCNRSLFVPPARPMVLESAATLPKGDTGIQVHGARHATIFGPDALSGTVRVRHGLEDDLDLSVEASGIHVLGDPPPGNDVSPNIYTARGGLKYRPWKHLSVAGGLGAGYSAGGAFVSPDAGPILAFENPYIVPFIAARAGVSQPIGPRAIDTTKADEPPGSHVQTPWTTWMANVIAGLRVPLGWSEPEAGTTRGSLLAGAGIVHLAHTRDKETFAQLALGGEIVF